MSEQAKHTPGPEGEPFAWREIAPADVGRTMLVSNNINSRNAFGDMSHRWIGWIQKSDEPLRFGKYICFDEALRCIHGLTHCCPIPAPDCCDTQPSRDDLLAALQDALTTIKALHGPVAWDIYERNAPEMKRYHAAISRALGATETK